MTFTREFLEDMGISRFCGFHLFGLWIVAKIVRHGYHQVYSERNRLKCAVFAIGSLRIVIRKAR